jgi:cytochrome bd ubiquinol oxidase subunit I
METSLLDSARLTFGMTAMYHFLFVPLTIGIAATATILQFVAILGRNQRLWSFTGIFAPIFFINFVCGMATGYPLRALIIDEWSSYYALSKEVFVAVFAFEDALLPVNLVLVLMYVFGRKRMPPLLHTFGTGALAICLMAQGSAILAINCYMQYPYGIEWENGAVKAIANLNSLFANPMWLPKLIHQMAAAMTMGTALFMAVSAVFIINDKHVEASQDTLKASSIFGVLSLLVTMWYGHVSAETVLHHQPMKFAAMEAVWDAQPGSAKKHSFVLVADPDKETMQNKGAIEIPGLLSLLVGTDSRFIIGISQLVELNRQKILDSSTKGETLGYASLLGDNRHPSIEEIDEASARTVPNVPIVFWAFRLMIISGLILLLVMLAATQYRAESPRAGRAILWMCVLACPLPWIAIEAGWVVAEAGRQPWVVTGILSTAKGASSQLQGVYAEKSNIAAVLVALSVLVVNLGLTALHLWRARK